jgi:Fuc2NAc and GlcNAc transferase
LLWAWIILPAVFVVDATVTLLRRLWRAQLPHVSHRDHAYQHAATMLRSHRAVAAAVGMINVCWLLPLALLVTTAGFNGAMVTVIAYLPVLWLAFRFRAGAAV